MPFPYIILVFYGLLSHLGVVRTDAGPSGSFEVKVGLHEGSVLSQLLFAEKWSAFRGAAC